MMRYLLPLMLMGSQAFAADIACKVAQNPESMTATIHSDDGSSATEAVSSASLVVGDQYGQNSIRLNVTTATGKTGEAYTFFNEALGAYSVECDGGHMSVTTPTNSLPGELVMTSDGVRIDVLGCDGEVYISTKGSGTQFLPSACPASAIAPPSSN